jgi:hypothetical protein
VTAVDARPATSAPDPASGAPGAAEQTAVQHVEVQHKLGRRVMDRITDLTGFTSSGLILLADTVGAWSRGNNVGGRPL